MVGWVQRPSGEKLDKVAPRGGGRCERFGLGGQCAVVFERCPGLKRGVGRFSEKGRNVVIG